MTTTYTTPARETHQAPLAGLLSQRAGVVSEEETTMSTHNEMAATVCPACGQANPLADAEGFCEYAPRAYHADCWLAMSDAAQDAALAARQWAGEADDA